MTETVDDAGVAGLSEAEKRKKGAVDAKIKKCLQHITILMEMWDPQRYEGRVLAANKVAWLEEVKKAYYRYIHSIFVPPSQSNDIAKKSAFKPKGVMNQLLASI